ncbi:DNA primase [Rhodobacter phage RcDurkin]|nr:DNA primase [Rhodobacter phage RcDurkin]QXN72543.1 DNA primase [Rhodobacter phage RcTiptonus]UUV43818.1 DNA primase [Rhodobacter phage RcKickapoo]UUV44444.1 DNA primase [Rhodobacter phage RcMenchie]
MDLPSIKQLLGMLKCDLTGATLVGSRQSRNQWFTIRCPFAQWTHSDGYDTHPSFGISIHDDGRSGYRCLSCGMKGSLSALPTRLGGYRKQDYNAIRLWAASTELRIASARPIPDWDSDDAVQSIAPEADRTFPSIMDFRTHPMAFGIPYLRKRGIYFQHVIQMGLRYDVSQHRVLFPVYDIERRFRGFTGRSVRPSKYYSKFYPKVKDYYGLNKRELLLGLPYDGHGPRIISEGLFDFGRSVSYGYTNARAVLGTALTPEKIDILISEGEPVYLLFDNDLPGWQAMFGVPDDNGGLDTSQAWAFRLFEEIPVWIVPYRETFDGKDPGSLDRAEYDVMIRNAWLFHGRAPLDAEGNPSMQKPA